MSVGISKRELLDDYYPDEICLVLDAYHRLHGGGEETERVDAMTFFGDGGEVMA